MRIAAIVGTMDEMDILPRNVEHLRGLGVDEIIVNDAGSTDGTREYVLAQEHAGDVWLFDEVKAGGQEVRYAIRTQLARNVTADWVLFVDSDEFWLPRDGDLRAALEAAGADVISVPRYNVVLGPDGPLWPDDPDPVDAGSILLYAQPVRDVATLGEADPSFPYIQGLLGPKTAIRPEALGEIGAGNHFAFLTGDRAWRSGVSSDIVIAHLPFRSHERYRMRARNATRAVAASPEYFSHLGWQFHRLAEELASDTTEQRFEDHRLDAAEIDRMRTSFEIRTADEIMTEPVPTYASSGDEAIAVTRAQPWLQAAARALDAHDLEPGALAHISAGPIPTVLSGSEHAARLFPPHAAAREHLSLERAAHAVVDAHASLPAPRLVGTGELEAGWSYSISTALPRATLDKTEPELWPASRRAAAAWMGGWLRALHAVDVDDVPGVLARVDWRAELEARHSRAASTARRLGLLPRWLIDDLERWLPSVEAMSSSPGADTLSHAALGAEHVGGRIGPGRRNFEAVGVFGLANIGVRHAMWDIGAPWWSVLRGDPGATRSFLREADLPGRLDPGFANLALAWVLLTPPPAGATLPEIGEEETLDDLARRWFSGPVARRDYVSRDVSHA